jgi:hypothetical protein
MQWHFVAWQGCQRHCSERSRIHIVENKLHRYRKRARTPSTMHPMKVPVHKIHSCFTILEERHLRMCISEKHAMSQYDSHCNFRRHIETSHPLSDVSRGRSLSKWQKVAKDMSDIIRTQFTYSVWAEVTSDSVYTTSCKDSSYSKWHWSMVLCQLPRFPLLKSHSTIASYSSITRGQPWSGSALSHPRYLSLGRGASAL